MYTFYVQLSEGSTDLERAKNTLPDGYKVAVDARHYGDVHEGDTEPASFYVNNSDDRLQLYVEDSPAGVNLIKRLIEKHPELSSWWPEEHAKIHWMVVVPCGRNGNWGIFGDSHQPSKPAAHAMVFCREDGPGNNAFLCSFNVETWDYEKGLNALTVERILGKDNLDPDAGPQHFALEPIYPLYNGLGCLGLMKE